MVSQQPTVIVVGAGLAGLTCAYRLSAHAVDVILLEAQARVGGRCWSSTGWRDGQVAEHGGEHIEAGQEHILDLIEHLGLELEDRSLETGDGLLRLGGSSMSPSVVEGLPQVLAKLRSELDAVGTATYDVASDAARTLDEWSIAEWVDHNVDGGRHGAMGRALESTSTLNLGLASTKSSALTLHNMFVGGLDTSENSDGVSFGHADNDQLPELHNLLRAAVTQVRHVRGGNDRIAAVLAERLDEGVLRMESPLTRLSRLADGRYEVEIRGDNRKLLADRVVLAVPLPCLRAVDLNAAGLSQRRHDAIAELPMGQGTKLLVQMDARLSDIPSWPGFAVSDRPDIAFWDTSAGQPGASGLLTLFTSGCIFASRQPHAAATPDVLVQAVAMLAEVLPGVETHVTDNAWLDSWPEDRWSQGSYAGFGPGQFTRYFGFLHLSEQGVHFAGEHTSMGSQGYLDGAVESGDRAAREVLSSVSS